MNILVVDDNKAVQDMLCELISSQGHNVDKAINGLDALGKVQQGNYHLFVIDHLMPLMNGLQLTKNIKNNPALAGAKVIFMTTQGMESIKGLAEFSLFDKAIDKPIDTEQFIAVLSELTATNYECDTLQVIG
ncbi:response regulator [Colwellia piezophila]|uniref:response regulator n=1 Tax=Colwellia piezophila TaxID=211668 RepID=UPI00037411DF|nr:response regulator [Colwellia piezophila]